MKNITTALLCLLLSVYSFGQCTHTLNMFDSWGDGWNGASAEILVNGTSVATATLGSGLDSGSVDFDASTGDTIVLSWTDDGSYPSEISWTVTDGEGIEIGSGSSPTTGDQDDAGTGNCPPPVQCTHTLNMFDSWGDGWNGASAEILVNGTSVATATLGSGLDTGSVDFDAATGDTIVLSWTDDGSYPSEISWTVTDGEGTEIGSGSNPTTGDQDDAGTGNCEVAPPPPGPTCTHTLNMFDSWGDGWNGASAEILVNGTSVATATLGSGLGEGSVDFDASTGDTIVLSWTDDGSYPSEISWTVTDGEGIEIGSGSNPTTGDQDDAGTGNCPPPVQCTHTLNMFDSWGDGWNGASAEILVNGTSVATATLGSGLDTGSVDFDAATGDTIVLSWTDDGSYPSEISWTVTDGGGTEIGSGSNPTTGDQDDAGTGNCPDCLPPSGLTLDSVSTTGAVVSWTGGDATSWEYELVIAGETPTGVGIATTTNPLTITGCYSNTAYDLYIRTDCGGIYSSWVAMSFTTSPACGDVIFDSGGENGNYSSNETITTTVFPINTGDVVTFTFTFFDIENGWDFLSVYNGPNATSPLIGTYTGNTIPDPITSTDVSGALTFVFESDGSVTDFGYAIATSCAPPPSCLAPTGLTISNIGGTTADFDWNAFDGNQSWEYVVVPTGDPAPTASGTFSAINSTTLTDLDFLTTYDVYVRAFCGDEDGYSVWSGPVTFTTTQQTDYTIDCSLGEPVNINYCYTNSDTTYWLFTSTDGFPLKIEFNAGTIEGFWDDLTIYDGPDNTFPVLFNNNDADIEDFTGLVVESTFPAVYVEVDSDGSGSCESSWSGSYIPWDFDVSCKTCITQTVEFSIDGACEPIQEFYINANVTDMGDAINLELTDNQGSPAQTTTQTGIVTFGPYPANQQVVITVVNSDDTSCSVDSDPLTFLCPPPPNDCSIVYAGEDAYFCSDGSTPVTLSASYHVFGQDTTSYDVTVQENCPAPNLSGGSPTSVNTDDVWSEVIDLGFEFCFFGETYSQVLIGSNGVLSFELENAETNNGWNLQSWFSTSPDTLPNSSNPTLSEGNIFGVGHDIDPSECGDINYMILGSAPARQFVVNYNEVCHFGFECSDNTSTSQIILHESSNVIDVNIIDKPLCTEWNDGLAVVGIQNIDDTVAFVAPDRNTSAWETSNEFWRFSPSVGEANYTFGWYDGDTLVSNEDTITVTPEVTTTYTAAVTYNLCNGDTATVTDTVVVELAPTPVPVPVSDEFQGCINEDLILEVNVDPTQESPSLVYYWSYNNEDVQVGPDNTYTIPAYSDEYGEYIVTAYNEETGCYSSTTIFSSTYLNQNCVDIPQGISPNGDGYNDCLILDHLEAQEDIIKAEIYNRYGIKVFELNDYVDHWCGQDASDGNLDSDELLPVGTYFYVIQYASEREPTISWIYLNY